MRNQRNQKYYSKRWEIYSRKTLKTGVVMSDKRDFKAENKKHFQGHRGSLYNDKSFSHPEDMIILNSKYLMKSPENI